jgi:hypothetical protein
MICFGNKIEIVTRRRIFLGLLWVMIWMVQGTQVNGQEKGVFPIIKFEVDTVDLGVIDSNDIVEFDIDFTNVGKTDLKIEVVSACKCIDIDWPYTPIKPGDRSKITVVFDSAGIAKGKILKTIDIISNTDPIVVEAKMKAIIR